MDFYNDYGSDLTKIYYHSSSLVNGAGDNSYRYSGSSNEVNNYVCFGSDASTCPNDNLYRIIGVFDNEIKLVKADYANANLLSTGGAYATSFSSSEYQNYAGELTTIDSYYWGSIPNNWYDSDLFITNLNDYFYNELSYTWRNKIVAYPWYTAGYSTSDATPAQFENAESSGMTMDSNVGLMYVSDYGFAASNTFWEYDLSFFDNCINNNWLFLGVNEWTMSRLSSSPLYVFAISSTGAVNQRYVELDIAVRPVFYLNSNVTYVSGSGTESDPIRIN